LSQIALKPTKKMHFYALVKWSGLLSLYFFLC
jgi:hypothetical protein